MDDLNVLLALNATNATDAQWSEHVKQLLVDPLVLHCVALLLGVVALLWSQRFPQVLAATAAITLGLWVGLMVQDKQLSQAVGLPIVGLQVPEGNWVPLTAGFTAAIAASVLAIMLWRFALAALTSSLLALLAMAICRLFNMTPQAVVRAGSTLLSSYRIVGAVVLVTSISLAAWCAQSFHKSMANFASAHIGTLLLLSGVSYLLQSAGGDDVPFSLLSDLAQLWSEVRKGHCVAEVQHCDCKNKCQGEITAWIASSWTVILGRWGRELYEARKRRREEENEQSIEERKPLKAPLPDPDPQKIGASIEEGEGEGEADG